MLNELKEVILIGTEEAKAFASEKNLIYLETSAKTGVSVPDLFEGLVKVVFDKESQKRADKSKKNDKKEDEEFSFWQKE